MTSLRHDDVIFGPEDQLFWIRGVISHKKILKIVHDQGSLTHLHKSLDYIMLSAVFSIGINRFCQNLFPNKVTIFLKMCVVNFWKCVVCENNYCCMRCEKSTSFFIYLSNLIFIKFKCVCLSFFLSVFLSVTVFLPDGLSDCPEIWHVD